MLPSSTKRAGRARPRSSHAAAPASSPAHRARSLAIAIALLLAGVVGSSAWPAEGRGQLLGPPGGAQPGDEPGDEEAPGDGESRRPNVVVIQTDDQKLSDIRSMPKTRRLLGRGGTTFRNYFATYPLCCPSRASLLTGQYSHNHGVISNGGPNGGVDAFDDSQTLATWLDDAGYNNGYVGKYLNGYRGGSVPPGWDEWYGAVGGGRMYGYTLFQQGPDSPGGRVVEYGDAPSDYQTDVYADKAVDFIERGAAAGQPFFLSVNSLAPHTENLDGPSRRNPRPAPRHTGEFERRELPKPPSYNERDVSDKPRFVRRVRRIGGRSERELTQRYRSRQESLLAVDDLVARVVRTLRSEGELDRTLVVFTSDNGYFDGEHRLKRGKKKLYEEATHVPLLVRGPGFPAGAVRRQLTGNIDVAPTILDVARTRASGLVVDGRSLREFADDRRGGRDREILYENGELGSTGIRTGRYVYLDHEGPAEELYDLRRDPFQLESLHRARDPRLARLERRLGRKLARLEDCAGPDQCG